MSSADIEVVSDRQRLRRRVAAWRARGERVALVPTMGNLHAGHLALVSAAHGGADRIVVSIFVNPTQFLPGEDYDAYPRTLDDDRRALASVAPDLIYTPAVSDLYEADLASTTRVEVPALDGMLCGSFRPGHFTGVATVVAKLFNLVQPDSAWFGDKDYQQLLLVRRLAADLCFPVAVHGVATVREADGLAMSSRNIYLAAGERQIAPVMFRTLQRLAEAVQAGTALARAEADALATLDAAGFRTQYVSVRRAEDLAPPGADDRNLVVLAAGYLGAARLIDHLEFTL